VSGLPFSLWAGPGEVDNPAGRVSQVWRDAMVEDPDLTDTHMVVELVLGNGRRFRLATAQLGSTNALGDARDVAPALMEQATITNTYDIDRGSSGARSVGVECPASFIDPVKQISRGMPLAGFGEVSLLRDGMSWHNRRVILRGDMAGGVSFGALRKGADQLRWNGQPSSDNVSGELFECKLQDPRDSANVIFPPYVVDSSSWDAPHSGSVGRPYPIVYGRFTVECPRVSDSAVAPDFIAALGHNHSIGAVYRNDVALAIGVDYTVEYSTDNDGISVTLISALPGSWADTDRVTAEVRPLVATDPDPDLFDVIRDLLQRYHPAGHQIISPQLFADAEAKVGGKRPVSLLVNTRSSLLSFIEEGLLEDYPMLTMVWDGGRYGPVLTDFTAPPRIHLEVGTSLLRFRLGGRSESPKNQAFNQFQIRYAFDNHLDDFSASVSAGPTTHTVCDASSQAMGPRVDDVRESVTFRDPVTAGWVLDWLVAHKTLPTYYTEYGGSSSLFFLLRRGDTVQLTDGDMKLSAATATVEKLVYERGFVRIGLRVWDNPLRGGL